MPATPQDHKTKAEGSREPFEFEHDGETFTVPSMSSVKAGIIRRLRRKAEPDFTFSLLEEVADEATLAAVDDMPTDEFNAFVEAWQAHSGVRPGES